MLRIPVGPLDTPGLLRYCRPRVGYSVPPVFRNGQPVAGRAIGLIWENMPTLAGAQSFLTYLEQVVAEAGHTLMVAASGSDADRESEVIRRLAAAGMGGLVIAPARHGARSLELERWIREERPLVLHGHPGRWSLPDALARRCCQVDVDNDIGVRQLLALLAGHGHRRVGFVGQESFSGSERFAAFRKLVPALGLQTKTGWQVAEAGAEADAGEAALAALQRAGALPTAFLCSHVAVARSLIEALRAETIRCPQDVSVVAFSDGRPADNTAGLTVMTINCEQQSHEMMRLLSRQFTGACEAPEHVRVQPVLLERGSVGDAGRGNHRS